MVILYHAPMSKDFHETLTYEVLRRSSLLVELVQQTYSFE
jgi:hypothetical protein